jgi:hypothetical protein
MNKLFQAALVHLREGNVQELTDAVCLILRVYVSMCLALYHLRERDV